MRLRLVTFAAMLALAGLAGSARQKPAPAPRDPLAPKSSPGAATIGPLHTATICTSDLAAHLRFLGDGLGMRARGPLPLDANTRARLNTLWGMNPGERWSMYLLDRPAVPYAVRVRLLVFDAPGPAVRQTHDPREPAPFTLGFPTNAAPSLDAAVRALGFESLAPMEQSTIPRPDGTSYGLREVVFRGPDLVHAVVVSRLDGMPQLGPVDPKTGHGGPVYSAQVVRDSEAIVKFYCDVLGMEVRSDREWKSGAKSAIGLPAGTAFRFTILYAPGATSGQLLLMDFRGATASASGVVPRPPSRGLGMYSFRVKSLDTTAAKIRTAGATVVTEPTTVEDTDLGRVRAMTVVAPNGVLVELFEPARPGR
jgi:catechol 2,3-dioxygenase-like lactoylglutathione lyase family enzyme